MASLDFRIDAPYAVVGVPFDVGVEITAKREMRVDHITVSIMGREGWFVAGVYRKEVLPHTVTLMRGGGTLRKGVNRLVATFQMQEGPPSHELDPAWVRYEVEVRVPSRFISWSGLFGHRAAAPLVVRAAPRSMQRYPMVARTSETEPVRMEISLASSRVIAGETVHGRCAVFGLPDERAREVELALQPVLVLKSTIIGTSVIRQNKTVTEAVLPAGTGGTSVPFAFTVPVDATPSFQTYSHEIYRELVVSTDHLRLVIPLDVLDPTAAVGMPPMGPAPLLGGEHIATTFDDFARSRHWQRDDRGTSHGITRVTDDVELRIDCEYRGKDGKWLVARATYPSLGLGLEVTPASLIRNVLGDIAIGDPEWDRAHHVEARSPEQAKPFVAAVAPATSAIVLGTLMRWADDAILYEQQIEQVDEPLLTAVADALATVARSIEEHRASIDPSPSIEIDRDLIVALARELRGRVAFGDLAIDGWLGRLPVVIRTHWERVRATRIVVVVGSVETATEFARMVDVAIPRPAQSEDLVDAEAKRLVGLATWRDDIVELRVTGGVVSVELLLDEHAERVAIDVERLRQLVEALHAIRVALEPAGGPYR